MMLLWVPLLFLGISFVFSMLGMGGGVLYIPILFWVGLRFKTEAIPLGVLLNVLTTASASVTYICDKLVDWRLALPFGLGMLVMPPLGAWADLTMPSKPVILLFALFTAAAGVLSLSGWKPKGAGMGPRQKLAMGLLAGAILGFFTGLLGRGGGAFVVPLLLMAGVPGKMAAATSSVVVTAAALSTFFAHLLTARNPRWGLWLLCCAAVLAGSQAGSRYMATQMKTKMVHTLFGLLLLAVAALLIVMDVL
jgi:uncharacterized membrane protein YfcA